MHQKIIDSLKAKIKGASLSFCAPNFSSVGGGRHPPSFLGRGTSPKFSTPPLISHLCLNNKPRIDIEKIRNMNSVATMIFINPNQVKMKGMKYIFFFAINSI